VSNDCEDQFPISIGFTATDAKKSLAFYRDQLGFTLKECWPSEDKPLYVSLVLDRQSIMLGQASSAEDTAKFCGGDADAAKFFGAQATAFSKNAPGCGVNVYVMVPDIDAYAAKIRKLGVKLALAPKTQFYGLRTSVVLDLDGYSLTFYTPVKMDSCQSCGMPLADAKPGQMYCQYCADETGHLRPYEQIFEGTVSGYFVAHMKMPRPQAEKAAKEHLAKMPAWLAKS